MIYAIVIAAIVLFIFFFAIRLCSGEDENYEEMIARTAEHDFQDCLTRMDGYNDDVIMDGFEERWHGYIPKQKLHYYIGRLIEAQTSFLGV